MTMPSPSRSSPPWKPKLLDRNTYHTRTEARTAVFDFIEGWYNPTRRHSTLGYQSPTNYERTTPTTH